MKYLLLVIIAGLLAFQSYSQTGSIDNYYSGLKPHIPQSPTSASLGFFSNYPVTQFTGVPDINLPIYKMEIGNVDIDISLRYNPNMVKVNTMAGWVGLGWSLQAGGVITRTVRDLPDDKYNGSKGLLYPCTYYGNGAEPITTVNAEDSLKTIGYENDCQTVTQVWRLLRTKGYENGRCDTEPDIFDFNFMGRTGKFFLNRDGTASLIPYQDLKIEAELDASDVNDYHLKGSIKSFTITDANGIKYIFAAAEITYPCSKAKPFYTDGLNSQDLLGSSGCSKMNTSWYLTKIIILNTGEEVNFGYEDETYVFTAPNQLSFRNCPEFDCEGSVDASSSNSGNQYNFPQVSSYRSVITMYGKRLSSIVTRKGTITFEAIHNREDLRNSFALTGITVTNNQNKIVFRNEFIYKYHICDTYEPDRLIRDFGPDDPNDKGKRLFLDRIIRKSNDLSEEYMDYQFEYDERVPMPRRGSFEQDFWGFFNNNGAKTLVPRLYVYPGLTGKNRFRVIDLGGYFGESYILTGADRFCNADCITIGTLKKIYFSTGGFSEFQFEPHAFSFENRNFIGGGIRLKKSIVHDNIKTENDQIREYEYIKSINGVTVSSGKIISWPVFAYQENTHGYTVFPRGSNYFFVDPRSFTSSYNKELYKYFLTRLSYPIEVMNSFDGINVAYTEIREINPGAGKTVFQFSLPGSFGENNDASWGICNEETDGYCDDLFHVNVSYFVEAPNFHPNCGLRSSDWGHRNADMKGINMYAESSMPFAPSLNYDWNRGLLLNKKEYSNAGNLVRDLKFKYRIFTPGNVGPKYKHGLAWKESDNWKLDYDGETGFIAGSPTSIILYSPYKVITGICKILEKEEQTLYNRDDPAKNITVTRELTYKADNLLIASETISQSDNRQLIKQYSYVKDHLAEYPFQDMSLKNIISEPVTTTTKINGSQTDVEKTRIHYSVWSPAIIKPFVIKKAIGANPYETDLTFLSTDVKGNYTGIKARDGIFKAFIYDYDNSFLSSYTEGATVDQVAYTSFEADNFGNWQGVTKTDITTGAAITGDAYFSKSGFVLIRSDLSSAHTYTVSYWSKNGSYLVNGTPGTSGRTAGNWTYYEHSITGSTSINVSGSGSIDELRLYPSNAQMTTYTLQPLVGITTMCKPDNNIEYYEYDKFNRLIRIRDINSHILKQYEYSFTRQYYSVNDEMTKTFTTTCDPGKIPTQITYVVSKGKHKSSIDKDHANQLAMDDINANGQNYADSVGECADPGIYAKITYENYWYYYTADVIVRFYKDAACTVPLDVSNLTIYVNEHTWNVTYETATDTPHTFGNINGREKTLFSQVLLYDERNGEIERGFNLIPNAAYLIAH